MLQMMFDDLSQLNGGNLNLLLENENTLDDITTTFSVTMAQSCSTEATANSQSEDSTTCQYVGYQQSYSPNNSAYSPEYQSSSSAVQNVRYQPYSRPRHDVPDHRRYPNNQTFMTSSPQYSSVPSTQVTYVTGVSHQTVLPSVCRITNYEQNGQQWNDQTPPLYLEQCNSNVNNNNSVANHPGFTTQCQNNSDSGPNQLPYTTQPIYHNYYNSDQQKAFQNIQYNSGSQPYSTMSHLNNPSSPIEAKKKTSPEQKKKNKKRKKKGVNEPQKPVSAYALFFRDTQAAIKTENASASFGEISKIVASMWDTLSEEAKQVYKQKTETAKRDYLKQLAMFKANTISMEALDADDEDTQPLSVLKEKMASSSSLLNASPAIIASPQVIDLTSPPVPISQPLPTQDSPPDLLLNKCDEEVAQLEKVNVQPETQKKPSDARSPSPTIAYKQIIVTSQKGCQGTITILSKSATDPQTSSPVFTSPATTAMKRIVLTPLASPVTVDPNKPSPIQLRNIVSKTPVTIIPSKQGQLIKVLPPGKVGTVTIPTTLSGKPNMIKLNMPRPIVVPRPSSVSPPPQLQSSTSISHIDVEPKQQEHEEIMEVDVPEPPKLQMRPPTIKSKPQTIDNSNTNTAIAPQPPNLKVIPKIVKQVAPEAPILNEASNMEIETPIEEISTPVVPRQSPLTIMLTEDIKKEAIPEQKPKEVVPPSERPRQCIRNECRKLAVTNPNWDGEYCGFECVAKHCRDVMNAWTSARQITASLG